MIKLGTTYIDPNDVQVVTFISETAVSFTLRYGTAISFIDVPADDVAAFRALWDRAAVRYVKELEERLVAPTQAELEAEMRARRETLRTRAAAVEPPPELAGDA